MALDTAVEAATTWDGPTVYVEVGRSSVADALPVATKMAAVETFDAQVGFLLQHVGPRVTFTALGLKDPRQLTKWWKGGEPKSPVKEGRVHLMFQIAYAITSVFDGATAARFFRVRSPYLGYVAPGEVLRTGNPDEVGGDLLTAASQFLGG